MRKHFTKVVLAVVMIVGVILAVTTTNALAAAASKAPAKAAPAATNHPQVKVTVYTSSFGTAGYTAAFAFGDLVNKMHPWLRIAVMETTQAADAIKTVVNDPNLKKYSIFPVASTLHNDLVNGTGSFKGKPQAYQALVMYNANAVAFVALDPKIQTMNDLNGKRLAIGSAGGAAPAQEAIIAAYGIKPAKIEKISWGPGKDALIDGKVDACAQTLGDTNLVPYSPTATIAELQTQKGFHIIPMDKDKIKKAAEATLLSSVNIRAGILGVSKPTLVSLNQNTWAVSPEFDAEAAYEIVKFIATHAKEFAGYDMSLAAVKRETLAAVPAPPVTFHPGAVKFYKEAKIKIGL